MKGMIRPDVDADNDLQLRRQASMARTYTQVNNSPPGPEAWSPTEMADARFKMCKKISELTMVVHLLFKQNHENELKSRLLHEFYNSKFGEMQKNCDEKIQSAQESAKNHREKRAEAEADLIEKLRKQNEELKKRVSDLELVVTEEHKIVIRLQENLATSATETQSLRHQLDQASASRDNYIDKKNSDIEQLKANFQNAERMLRETQLAFEQQHADYSAMQIELRQHIRRLQEQLDEQEKMKEQLLSRNTQLSQELRNLRVTTAKQISSLKQVTQLEATYSESTADVGSLRNELLRYKMELQNREENYNRVFTQFQPVRLDKQAGKIASERDLVQSSLTRVPTAGAAKSAERMQMQTANSKEKLTADLELPKTGTLLASYRSNSGKNPTSAKLLRPSQAMGVDMLDLSKPKANAPPPAATQIPITPRMAPQAQQSNVQLSSLKSLLSRQRTVPASSIAVGSDRNAA